MGEVIRIQMMGEFAIYIGEQKMDQLVSKSRKGVALMQYLILHRNEPVPNYRLLETLWTNDQSSNPENALKTLVSRMRAVLNRANEGLGGCIVAERGAYRWQCMEGMSIDAYEIDELFSQLGGVTELTPEAQERYNRVIKLYAGDLLQGGEQTDWALARAVSLHNQYLVTVHKYVELLKAGEQYDEMINVCRAALDVDAFDEQLHLELMGALTKAKRNNEALLQYKHVTNLHFRYLGVQPPAAIQEFYKQIVQAGKTLDFNLDTIRNELREHGEVHGAFVCEYAVFKEIFNLQMRNLERLGSTMFLGLIMISSVSGGAMNPLKQNDIMQGLLEILKANLRKGDTITHFSPTLYALLLPTVNYTTGNMVMERVKRFFYRRYPNSSIMFSYRVGPLSSDGKNTLK
ncbi:MAG: BTAD domain-containing putative transcriptional regulator [Eubacteriales bacterium]|nr:BTAD domain-containing putative transcriptional regulator [Christensenellaceae bacterium]MEA5065412.1 BTAD domain-containing putative transcriptional regulator [Eubacteriales bacterium]